MKQRCLLRKEACRRTSRQVLEPMAVSADDFQIVWSIVAVVPVLVVNIKLSDMVWNKRATAADRGGLHLPRNQIAIFVSPVADVAAPYALTATYRHRATVGTNCPPGGSVDIREPVYPLPQAWPSCASKRKAPFGAFTGWHLNEGALLPGHTVSITYVSSHAAFLFGFICSCALRVKSIGR